MRFGEGVAWCVLSTHAYGNLLVARDEPDVLETCVVVLGEFRPGKMLVPRPTWIIEVLVEDDDGARHKTRATVFEHHPGTGVQVEVNMQERDRFARVISEKSG